MDELEQQIEETKLQLEETKLQLSDKLGTLEQQVSQTVETASTAVAATVEAVQGTVESMTGAVEDAVHGVHDAFDLQRQIQKHPFLVIGGAVVVGYVAAQFFRSSSGVSRSPSSTGFTDDSATSENGRYAHPPHYEQSQYEQSPPPVVVRSRTPTISAETWSGLLVQTAALPIA